MRSRCKVLQSFIGIADVACRGLWRVVGNKSKDIGMGIRKSIVVSFLPCLDAFCGSIPIHF